MGAEVSVIVTSWNSERLIGRCLRSLMAQEGLRLEVVVVDNGSTDETRTIIRREAPQARLVALGTNRGPAAARNLGIQLTHAPYVLTLDHDVELATGFLWSIVAAADASAPQIGMWSGKILRFDRCTIDSTGIILTTTWRAFDRGSGVADADRVEDEAILGPSACAALYRRSMLEELREGEQYFDERFFFLWEDVELAWRATHRGWGTGYVPQAIGYHVRNGTRLSRRARQALSWRNRYLFLAKHQLWRPLPRYLWQCGMYDVARLSLMALTNPKALREIASGWEERSVGAEQSAGMASVQTAPAVRLGLLDGR